MQLQAAAQQAIDEHEAAIAAARNKFTAGLDPTGTQAGAVPIDAAERVQAELMAQEQARQAAQAANVAQVAQEGQNLRAGQGGGVSSPVDAAEALSGRVAAARGEAKAGYGAKYGAAEAVPGQFEPGAAGGFRQDVEKGLLAGDSPTELVPGDINTQRALDIIDRRLNAQGPGTAAGTAPQ